MSVYRALGIEPPVILFSVIHQPGPSVEPGQYAARSTGFQRGVRKQDGAVRERLEAWLWAEADRRARDLVERLPGGAEAGHREAAEAALREGLRAWASELVEADRLGLVRSWECRTADVGEASGDVARLLAAGGQYLESLGMKPGNGGPVHESAFLFRGSVHYDVVEHLVRDLMGIYVGPHGALIQHVTRAQFGTLNFLHAQGDADAWDGSWWEVNLPFSKGPIQYEEFRSRLRRAVDAIHVRLGGTWASAWQRKLGLGQVREFSIRFACPRSAAALSDALGAVAEADDYLAEGVVRRGRMVVMERLPV